MNKKKASVGRITKVSSHDKETLFIKHEFRNELLVVNEAISQVLGGLPAGGKDCPKCFNLLKLALVHVNRISDLIDGLSKVCAVKPALIRKID